MYCATDQCGGGKEQIPCLKSIIEKGALDSKLYNSTVNCHPLYSLPLYRIQIPPNRRLFHCHDLVLSLLSSAVNLSNCPLKFLAESGELSSNLCMGQLFRDQLSFQIYEALSVCRTANEMAVKILKTHLS